MKEKVLADDNEEVTDEDESAEADESMQQDKQKKKSKLKLSQKLSDIVGMKSVHFNGTDETPSGSYLLDSFSKRFNDIIHYVFCLYKKLTFYFVYLTVERHHDSKIVFLW